MNKKKMSKRQRDIKSKLMAAIAMLLVSSIMMVSTTYAWFTLSTAPEVTGITTAVGANGNLEIALQNPEGTDPAASKEGDSNKAVAEKNITWGNLVALDDNNVYGLDKVAMYPSELASYADGDKTILGSTDGEGILSTPVYGADGRISALETKTILGTYNNGTQKFTESDYYGVRAVGMSSEITARNQAWRDAKSLADSNVSLARGDAQQSLAQNGGGLASIAITHATADAATEAYTQAEVQYLRNAVTGLTNAMDKVEISLKNYIIAHSIAKAADDAYETIVTQVTALTAENLSTAASISGVVMPTNMDKAIAKLAAARANLNDAQTKLDAIGTTNNAVTWAAISGAMAPILNTDKMLIEGKTVSEVKADMNPIVDAVIDKGQVNVSMTSGAGAYADLADIIGEYYQLVVMKVTYKDVLQNKEVKAVMTATPDPTATDADGAPISEGAPYIPQMVIDKFVQGEGGDGTAASSITEFYGYIIDLAFRTNASGSNLLLQEEGVQRIYDESNNTATMGNGANMTFTSADPVNFPQARVESLMSNIRIVFFQTGDKVIKAYGKLDMANVTPTEEGLKASIILTEADYTTLKADNVIMPLNQNEVHKLSALVYLDGNSVTNADVAATSTQSMTGTMNLQFASSANLIPMTYGDLLEEGAGADGRIYPTVNSSYNFTAIYENGTLALLTKDTIAESNVYVSIDGGAYEKVAAQTNEAYPDYTGFALSNVDIAKDSKVDIKTSDTEMIEADAVIITSTDAAAKTYAQYINGTLYVGMNPVDGYTIDGVKSVTYKENTAVESSKITFNKENNQLAIAIEGFAAGDSVSIALNYTAPAATPTETQLTNVSNTGLTDITVKSKIFDGTNAVITLEAAENKTLPDTITVKMDDSDLTVDTDYTYVKDTGVLTITKSGVAAGSKIEITAAAVDAAGAGG